LAEIARIITPLLLTLPEPQSLNPFRIRNYEKVGGGDGPEAYFSDVSIQQRKEKRSHGPIRNKVPLTWPHQSQQAANNHRRKSRKPMREIWLPAGTFNSHFREQLELAGPKFSATR
jgi:hypothetical protein